MRLLQLRVTQAVTKKLPGTLSRCTQIADFDSAARDTALKPRISKCVCTHLADPCLARVADLREFAQGKEAGEGTMHLEDAMRHCRAVLSRNSLCVVQFLPLATQDRMRRLNRGFNTSRAISDT
jgi:hypothetical protein